MDILITLLACLALGAPIGLAGSVLIGRGPELMAGLFSRPTGLGWPRGVQEEDPPGGWMWHLPTQPAGGAARHEQSRQEPARPIRVDLPPPIERGPRPEIVDADSDGMVRAEPRLEPLIVCVHAGSNRVRSGW